MNDTLMLYVFTRLNTLSTMVGIILLFSSLGLLTIGAGLAAEGRKPERLKKYLWIPIVSLIMFIATPTKTDAMFIVAGTKIIEISKDPDVQRVAGKSVKLIENYIDSMMETK